MPILITLFPVKCSYTINNREYTISRLFFYSSKIFETSTLDRFPIIIEINEFFCAKCYRGVTGAWHQ